MEFSLLWSFLTLEGVVQVACQGFLVRKDPDAGKDVRQEDKGTAEDEMVGRHH